MTMHDLQGNPPTCTHVLLLASCCANTMGLTIWMDIRQGSLLSVSLTKKELSCNAPDAWVRAVDAAHHGVEHMSHGQTAMAT